MKSKRVDLKKLLLVAVMAVLVLVLFAACGDKTGTGSVSGGTNNAGGDSSGAGSTSVVMRNGDALEMLFDAMIESKNSGYLDEKFMNFEFSTFFILEREMVYKTYYVDFKGALDIQNGKDSKLSIVIREDDNGTDKVIMGIYGEGGNIYIDTRNVSDTGVQVLKIDDFDLEWFVEVLDSLFTELDLGGFMEGLNPSELIGGLLGDLGSIGGMIEGLLGTSLSATLVTLAGDGQETVVTTDASGVTTMSIPLSTLNGLLPIALGMIPTLAGDIMGDIYDIAEIAFGWDLNTILGSIGKDIGAGLVINGELIDGRFNGMDFEVRISDNRPEGSMGEDSAPFDPLSLRLGANNFSIGSTPSFEIPDFSNMLVEDFSLTTINADVEIEINAKEHTYTLNGLDTAMGNIISSLLDLDKYTELANMPIAVDDTVFRLWVKIRAEIDLKDNRNTQGLVEIYGGENNSLRAGLYYSGANEAVYVDLSGMGGGRYKIGSYVKTTEQTVTTKNTSGQYILMQDGYFEVYDPSNSAHVKRGNEYRYDLTNVTTSSNESINLNNIIKDSLLDLIKAEVPSLMRLIGSLTGDNSPIIKGEGAASADDIAAAAAIAEAVNEGRIVIPRYYGSDAFAQATVETSVDTMALIKQILANIEIIRGEERLEFDKIMLDLSGSVLDTILSMVQPGLVLPVTRADVVIDSEDMFGINGIFIDLALGTAEEPDLFTLSLPITLSYGTHIDDWQMPNFNDSSKPFIDISLNTDENGNMESFSTIALSLSGEIKLSAAQTNWELTQLESLLYGLLLTLNIENDIELHYGFTVDVNLDITKISTDTINAISAKVQLIKNPDINSEATISIYFVEGKLYLDAQKAGIPPVMIDVSSLMNGVDFAGLLFSKDPTAGGQATATADPADNTGDTSGDTSGDEGSSIDALALIGALIKGVNINSGGIEVLIATNFIQKLIEIMGAENLDQDLVEFIGQIEVTEGSGIAIQFEGLNLSQLWIAANIGVSSGDDFALDLGLGLGHILVGLEPINVTPVNAGDFADIMSTLKFGLNMSAQVDISASKNDIELAEMLGALFGSIALNLNIEEDINPGIEVNLSANLDLGTVPEYNETQLKLEIYGVSSGKLLAGIYYSEGMLYADIGLLGVEKFYMPLDIITLIQGAIADAGTDNPDSAGASVDIAAALDGLDVLVMLSNQHLQVEVAGGITAALLSIVVDAIEGDGTASSITPEMLDLINRQIAYLKGEGEPVDGFDIPDIGLSAEITWKDDNNSPLINALGLDVNLYILDDAGAKAANIAIGVHDIGISFKCVDLLAGIDLGQFTYAPLITIGDNNEIGVNLENVYFQTIGYIYLAAFETGAEDNSVRLGDYLTQFFETDGDGNIVNNENADIFNAIVDLCLRFRVYNSIDAYAGFRIAANLNLDPLINKGENDAVDVAAILSGSELALEIFNGKYSEENDPLISLYLQNGIAYLRLAGDAANDVRLKVNLFNTGLLDLISGASAAADGEGTQGGTTTEPAEEPMDIQSIMKIIDGVLSSISVNRTEISVNLAANLLGTVIDLILEKEGTVLPELNEENSKLWFALDDNGNIALNLMLGIDPIAIGLSLGNLSIGFSEGTVVPVSEEMRFESDYKSLADLSQLSLSAQAGINVNFYQSELPVGDIISSFVSDLAFALDLDIEEDVELALYANLSANLDFASVDNTQIALEIYLERETSDIMVLGAYIDGADIYLNFPALNISAVKITNISALEEVMSDIYNSISGLLGQIEGGGAAMATADGDVQDAMDAIFILSDNYIKIQITNQLIVGVLRMLPTFGVSIESSLVDSLVGLIEMLGLEVNLGYDTDDFVLDVAIETAYLGLGIWLGNPVISVERFDDLLAPVQANPGIYTEFSTEGNVYVELEFAIRYALAQGETDLSPLLDSILGTVNIEGFDLKGLLNGLLIRLATTSDAKGQLGVKVMANANVMNMINNADSGDVASLILDNIEAGIEISVGSKKAYVMLTQFDPAGGDNTSAYLFFKLDEIGAPNFKLNLTELIGSAGNLDAGGGASSTEAAAAGDTVSDPETEDTTLQMISKLLNLEGNGIALGGRGLEITLAREIIAVLLSQFIDGFVVYDENGELTDAALALTFVDETKDDSAFKTVETAEDSEIADNRPYVKIDGTYVLFESDNPAHAGLQQYYKVRSTGITFKTDDPRNGGKASFNIDLALNLGLDIGISIYGYAVGFGSDNLYIPLGDKNSYADINNIMQDKLYVSIDGYFDLSAVRDEDYNLSPLIGGLLGDNEMVSGLADLLTVLSLKEFQNLVQFRISASLTLGDLIGGETDLSRMEASIVIFRTLETLEEEILIGLYLRDNNLYIDARGFKQDPDYPVLRVADFTDGLMNIIGSLSTGTDEASTISTEDDGAQGSADGDELGLALDIVLGSAGLGVVVYEDLVYALIAMLAPSLDLDLSVFGDINLSVMLNFNEAESLRDISLDIGLGIGALNLGLGIGNVVIDINSENVIVPDEVVENSRNIVEMPLSLGLVLQVELSADQGVLDVGTLLSDFVPGLNLEVNVPDNGGTAMLLEIAIDVTVNLGDFNTLEAAVTVTNKSTHNNDVLLKVIYSGGVIYVDGSGLGISKVSITGLDLGGLLEDKLGGMLGHETADGAAIASAEAFDPSAAAILVLLDGHKIGIEIGMDLIRWVLDIPAIKEQVDINKYLPDGLDISAFFDINYLNDDGLLDLSIFLKAQIANLLGIGFGLSDILIDFEPKTLNDIQDTSEYVEIMSLTLTEDAEGNIAIEPEIKLEYVGLGLELSVESVMSGGNGGSGDPDGQGGVLDMSTLFKPLFPAVEDLMTQIKLPEDVLNHIIVSIDANVRLLDLIDLLSGDEEISIETLDFGALLEMVELSLEIYNEIEQEILVGLYLKGGNVYIYLQGIGLQNIVIEKSFIINIIDAVMPASGAAGSSMAAMASDGTDDTSAILGTVATIVNTFITGLDITGQTLVLVIENSYLVDLIHLVFPDMNMGQIPELDIGKNSISINMHRGHFVKYSEASEYELFYAKDMTGKYVFVDGAPAVYDQNNPDHRGLARYNLYVLQGEEYVEYDIGNAEHQGLDIYIFPQRNGLLEVDLSFYTSTLGIYLPAPEISLTGIEIELPVGTWVSATDVRGVSLELRGTMGVDTADTTGKEGFTAGNILGGILGDLEAPLLLDGFSASVEYEICAYIGFDYSLAPTKSFSLTDLDLSIRLGKTAYDESGNIISQSPQITIVYSSATQTAYLDLAFFGLPKLSIGGISLTTLLNDVLGDAMNGTADGSAVTTDGIEGEATENIFTKYPSVIAIMQPNMLAAGISAKFVIALVEVIAGEKADDIVKYIPNVGLEIDATSYPLSLGLILQLQNADCQKVVDLFLTFNGFDYDEFGMANGSDIRFYTPGEYNGEYIIVDPNEFTSVGNINIDADTSIGEEVFDFNLEKLALELQISLDFIAPEEIKDWSEYFTAIFGMSDEEFDMLIAVLEKDSNSSITLTLQANINLAGLINGFDLNGTEILLALDIKSDISSQANMRFAITVAGKENGVASVYIDLSGWRNKGQYKLDLNIGSLLSGAIGGASAQNIAGATAEPNYGLLPENIFSIINGIFGYLQFSDSTITVGFNNQIISAIFDLLLANNPNFEQGMEMPTVEGGLSIDTTNWTVSLNMKFDSNMDIKLGIKNIKVGTSPSEAVPGSGSLLPENADSFTDIMDMRLLVELIGSMSYQATQSSETNPAVDLSGILSLITNESGLPLIQNPQLQIRIGEDISMEHAINTRLYVDTADFMNIKVAIEIFKNKADAQVPGATPQIGIYLDGSDIFVDLGGLGIPKLHIANVNLGKIINDAIDSVDILAELGIVRGGASASSDATASVDSWWGETAIENAASAYLALIFAPEKFAIGVNVAMIDAIVQIVMRSRGEVVEEGTQLLPNFGELGLEIDSTSGKPLPAMRLKLLNAAGGTSLEGVFKLDDIVLNASDFSAGYTYGSWANTSTGQYGFVGDTSRTTTYNGFMEHVYSAMEAGEYSTVYDLESGKILLDKIAIGADLTFSLNTKEGVNDINSGNYKSSLQYYLSKLINSFLGDADDPDFLSKFAVVAGENKEMIYTVSIRIVVNVGSLITDSGFDIMGILDSEMSIEAYIGGQYNKKILGLYKLENDSTIYADLSGLGLPKIQLFGLDAIMGMLPALGAASDNAMSTAVFAAADTDAEVAFAELVLQDGLIGINIEPEFIYQILEYAGYEVGSSDDGYKTMEYVTEDNKVMQIPLPNAQSVSITLNILDKLESLDLTVFADQLGTTLSFGLSNLQLTTDTDGFIPDSMKPVTDEYGALQLASGGELSLTNILSSVLEAHDLNLGITYAKNNTTSQGSNRKSQTVITIRTTKNGDTSQSGGINHGNNKLNAALNINTPANTNNKIDIYLYNNKISGDISGAFTKGIVGGVLNLNTFKDMEFADLNIIELIGNLGSASASANVATSSADGTEGDTSGGLLGDMTINDILKGIKVNWWYGNVHNNLTPNERYSTIRIELGTQLINTLMILVNNLIYGFATDQTDEQKAAFDALSYEEKLAVVRGYVNANDDNNLDAKLYNFLIDMLSDLAGINIGTVLGIVPQTRQEIKNLIESLLPLPILNDGQKAYIDITLDKGTIGSGDMALVHEIGIYLGCEKGTAYGNLPSNSAFIVINNNGINIKNAVNAKWANENEADALVGNTYSVSNPFDPWELSASALTDASRLPQRAYLFFGDNTNNMNTEASGGNTTEFTGLAGSTVVWDSSSVNLVPGTSSTMYGYAGNQRLGSITVQVSNTYGMKSLYGYLDADNNFIRSTSLVIDATGTTPNSLASMPKTIVIVLNNGYYQVLTMQESILDTTEQTKPVIPGITDKATTLYGNFGLLSDIPDSLDDESGNYEIEFWYQYLRSGTIQSKFNLTLVNRKVSEIVLPVSTKLADGSVVTDKYNFVGDSSTFDVFNLKPYNYDIGASLAELTTVDVVFADGSTGKISADWSSAVAKLNRYYNKDAAYKGVDVTLDVSVGGAEGIAQTVPLRVYVESKVVKGLTKTDGASRTFNYNPYDEYNIQSILKGSNVYFDIEVGGADAVSTSISNLHVNLPELSAEDKSFEGKGSFIITFLIGGVEVTDSEGKVTVVGAQEAKARVYVNAKILSSATVQVDDIANALNLIGNNDNGTSEFDVLPYISNTVNAKFADGTSTLLKVKSAKMASKVKVTNAGGVFTADIVVGSLYDQDNVNDQSIRANLIVPRINIMEVRAVQSGFTSDSPVYVTYNKGGQTVTTIEYKDFWASVGNVSALVNGVASAAIGGVAGSVKIGSEQFDVVVTDTKPELGSSYTRGALGSALTASAMSAADDLAVASADGFLDGFVEITDVEWRSITFDPMTDKQVYYPEQIEVTLSDGSTKIVGAEFYSFTEGAKNGLEILRYRTLNLQDGYGNLIENRMYEAAYYATAQVRLYEGVDEKFVTVPVTVPGRVVVGDTVSTQVTIVNPYSYTYDPASAFFSLQKTATVTFDGGDYRNFTLHWNQSDIAIPVIAENGATFSARVTYGEGLQTFTQAVSIVVRPYILTPEKLSAVQDALDAKTFYAYDLSGTGANNPYNIANYPSEVTLAIGLTGSETLSLRWDLSALKFNYEGGVRDITVLAGNDMYGYQDVVLKIDIKPCIIESINIAEMLPAQFVNYATGLDILTVGRKTPAEVSASAATAKVKFSGIEGLYSESVRWTIEGLDTLDFSGGSKNAVITIRDRDIAGAQKYNMTFVYTPLGITEVRNVGGGNIFNNLTINPYESSVLNTPDSVEAVFTNNKTIVFNTAGTNGYKLIWDRSGYNTSYNSTECYVNAKLNFDGITYSQKFEFNVINYRANKISWGGTEYNVVDGKVTGYTYQLDPFDPNNQAVNKNVTVKFTAGTGQSMTKDFTANVSMLDGFKLTTAGGNYRAALKVGNNETIYVDVYVVNRTVTIGGKDVAAASNDELKAIASIAGSYSLGAGLTLPSSTSELSLSGSMPAGVTAYNNIYWKVEKYNYSTLTTNVNVMTFSGNDFTGNYTGTKNVVYNKDSVVYSLSQINNTSKESTRTLDTSKPCKYVLTAYIGRVYQNGGNIVVWGEQASVQYTVFVGDYEETSITESFMGAWRSDDNKYNYIVFDANTARTGRFITSGSQDFTYTYTKDETTGLATITTSTGLTITQTANGQLKCSNGITFVPYDLQTAVV